MTDDDKKLCEREIIDRFMAIPSAQHGEGRMFTLDEAKVVISHIEALSAEVEGLRSIMCEVEPYLDAIIDFASTMGEHEPNRIAAQFRAALATKDQSHDHES